MPDGTVTLSKEQFENLMSRVAAIETKASDTGVVVRQCNVSGKILADGEPSPFGEVNHVGQDRFGDPVLIRQTAA